MNEHALDTHMGRAVVVDVCGPCQSLWLDLRENLLDLNQAATLVAQLREADRPGKPVDPALPLALARARREAEEAFAGMPKENLWREENRSFGLVGAGLTALVRLLKRES